MENFVIYNPVKLHFGRNVVEKLGDSLKGTYKRIMLVYGGGSIKRNRIYEDVTSQFSKAGVEVIEFSGIKPNPWVLDVDKAAEMGRKEKVDAIVAVGGGSVIDSAKIISIAIPADHGAWLFMNGEKKPERSIPLYAVLTLAATGTEMNRFAVLQNNETKEKNGFGSDHTYPVESFLDPQYTVSVPKDYTGYGIVDLVAHCLEAFFGEGEATLSDRFIYSIINEARKYGELLLDDLENYALREKIMYAATMALNNLTAYGRKNGDWGVHAIGHVLSVLYDTPHGATLSIAFPAWLKLNSARLKERIEELGQNVFQTNSVDDTIFELENFFASVESPIRLSDIGIENREGEIFDLMVRNNVTGNHIRLEENDYRKLIELMA
jgi:alcohol dehydrogenase YqhD (iron-dependent ADH family)